MELGHPPNGGLRDEGPSYNPATQGLSLALLQFNPSSVVVMDSEGRIRSLNRNAERLLSTTEPDAIGKSYTDVFGPSLSQRVFRLVLKAGAIGEVRSIEATLPDGRRAKLRATAGPLRDQRGRVSGIVFVADEDTSTPKLDDLPRSSSACGARSVAISARPWRSSWTPARPSSTWAAARRP